MKFYDQNRNFFWIFKFFCGLLNDLYHMNALLRAIFGDLEIAIFDTRRPNYIE